MDNLLHEYILYQGDFTGASARKNHLRVIQYCVAAKIIHSRVIQCCVAAKSIHSRVIQYRVIAETINSRVIKCCVAGKTIHSRVIQRSVAASQWYCFYPFTRVSSNVVLQLASGIVFTHSWYRSPKKSFFFMTSK